MWNPHLKKHISSVENVQRRVIGWYQVWRVWVMSSDYEHSIFAVYEIQGWHDRSFQDEPWIIWWSSNKLLFKYETSRARGHDFNIYKLGCRRDVKKYSFRLRVASQWNNLPDSVVNADSMNSFKNRLDKFWNDSEVMYNPETNIYDITTSRSSRHAHHVAADEDPDLMPEAYNQKLLCMTMYVCMYVCI